MMSSPIVSLVRCESYDRELVAAAVGRLLEPLGGMRRFVSSGQRVLIKPNMLTDREPECAVTTHPELVRAVVRMVRACGGTPVVGDSPASAVKLSRVHDKTGIASVCTEEGVDLLNFEQSGSVNVGTGDRPLMVAAPVMAADVIINLPKVKTHVLTVLTAGIKNMYGVLPGYQKAHLHKRHPDVGEFAKLLNELHGHVSPAVTIADGILGMEGDGPSGGDPVGLGLLAASTDDYSLDRALCDLLGIPPASVPYLLARNGAPPSIEAEHVGEPLEALKPNAFRVPGTLMARLMPTWLVRFLDPWLWVRPAVSDLCVACKRCVDACPAGALHLDGDSGLAHLTPSRCIGCCCCHEVCPAKAIDMVLSPLLGLLRRGRTLS